MLLEPLVHQSSVPLQSSFPPTTLTGWLVVLALVLFAGAYVGVCILAAVWVRRDARRTGRARPTLWAGVIGVSLLSSGLVGLFLFVVYLWGRDSVRFPVAGE
jgi:hypothetical protein